jgi:acyl-CoA hydrolase
MKGAQLSLADAAALVRRRDTLTCGLALGQPIGLLEAIGARDDFEDLQVFSGLFVRPYPFLTRPGVRVVSGFFGPIERMARAAGLDVQYLAADFTGLERLVLQQKPRVVVAATTPPDAEGWMSFALHAGAHFTAFRDAARDPDRLAIAEANSRLPRVHGLAELGGHRVHVSEVDAWVTHDDEPMALPMKPASPEEVAIAAHAVRLVEDGATLQLGIGTIPDQIAQHLAAGFAGDFGIHTEMLSDGVMRLHQAGKVSNRKGLYDGVSVATFALGCPDLYRWLDRNPAVALLPVSATNDAALVRRLRRFVSVNGALMVDLAGQLAADHIRGKQYSGVGGHETFVAAAREAPGGKSIVCLKSTATVAGRRVSTIVPRLPADVTVTTPRQHTHWVVTEHGAVDVSALPERARADALVGIAHPDFRDELRAASRSL